MWVISRTGHLDTSYYYHLDLALHCWRLFTVWKTDPTTYCCFYIYLICVNKPGGFIEILYVDWRKQQKLIELFANDKVMRGSDVLVIEDRTRALNIMAREYRFYEWNGIVARAFGNEKRFSIDGRNFNAFRHENSFQKIFMNGDNIKPQASITPKIYHRQ